VIRVFEISTPRASTEAKPGKAKKKPWNSFRAVSHANDIEIYEGKVVAVGVRDIEEQFHIPSHVVDCFKCVDIILHGDGEPQLPPWKNPNS
jgi:hypothetical protein